MQRRQLLKLGGAGLVMAASPLLTSCGMPDYSEQIRMGITNRPRNLDPRRATDALSSRINRLIYRQLIDFNQHSQPIADLASWQQLSPTHYRFTLIDTPIFHHGKQLNAHDVVATYQSILDPKTGSPHRGTLKHIAQINVLNETELEFILNQPDALFVGRLTLGILPEDLLQTDHSFNMQPIGAGPARFVSLNEQRLVLRRPDDIELHFVVVKDAMVRVLKLEKGEIDLVQNDLSPELAAYCAQQPGLVVDWQKGTSHAYVGFNLEDPLVADPRLRQALAHGINRQQIIDAIFNGQARLAGGLLAPEHWAGHPELNGWAYQPETAKQLIADLKQAHGLKGNIKLSFKTSSDPTRIRLATLYQAQLKSIGIELDIQSYDWGTFYSDIVKGRFQLYGLAWVGIKSPDIFHYVYASEAVPPQGANRGRYRNEYTDQLIALADQAQEPEQQAVLYRQLQQHLQQDLPVIPLWFENQYAVMRANLQGFELFADGRFDSLLTVKKRV